MLKLWPVLAQFTAPELWVQVEYLVRIFVAACLGLLIGSERKNRNKSAGIRTHVIVALGAALIMVVSKYGFMDVEKADAARVAAQVVSGIGFLGAGVIFVRNNLVNGLTTAPESGPPRRGSGSRGWYVCGRDQQRPVGSAHSVCYAPHCLFCGCGIRWTYSYDSGKTGRHCAVHGGLSPEREAQCDFRKNQ